MLAIRDTGEGLILALVVGVIIAPVPDRGHVLDRDDGRDGRGGRCGRTRRGVIPAADGETREQDEHASSHDGPQQSRRMVTQPCQMGDFGWEMSMRTHFIKHFAQ